MCRDVLFALFRGVLPRRIGEVVTVGSDTDELTMAFVAQLCPLGSRYLEYVGRNGPGSQVLNPFVFLPLSLFPVQRPIWLGYRALQPVSDSGGEK